MNKHTKEMYYEENWEVMISKDKINQITEVTLWQLLFPCSSF